MQGIQWGTTALVFLVALAAACEALISIPDRKFFSQDLASQPCVAREPPPPPSVIPASTGKDLDLTFAIRKSQSGIEGYDDAGRPLYEDIGFDLDHSCTPSGRKPGCVEPSWADAAHDENPDGIDNANAQSLWKQQPDPGFIDAGLMLPPKAQVLLIRVTGYNGGADDDHVKVAVYVGVGAPSRPDGGTLLSWDGNDTWAVFQETVSSEGGTPDVDQPLYADSNAYVTNHVVVAHLPEARWPSVFPAQPARVTGVVMAGTLTAPGDTGELWSLTNLVYGLRISATESLMQIGGLYDGPGYLCGSPIYYLKVKHQGICPVVDMASDPNAGPSSPCNALSLGALAQGVQAKLGGPSPTTWTPVPCAPTIDPYTDTCDKQP